jgi:hypothetical protein
MQLVQLDHWWRRRQTIELQAMEIVRPSASGLQESLDGLRLDVTDIGGRLDGTAVGQTFDEANHSDEWQLGIVQESSLVLAKTLAAVGTVQTADVLVHAPLFNNAEVASGEAVETRAIRVGTGKAIQGFGRGSAGWLVWKSANHESSPNGAWALPA